MKLAYYPLYKLGYRFYWKIKSLAWLFTKKPNRLYEKSFSIAIVTYADRFDTYFKPLIKQLNYCFPGIEIVAVLNGHHDQLKQKKYLEKASLFLNSFKHVKIIDFEQPQSLSKLWNLAILNASCTKLFILNDDLKLLPTFGKTLLKDRFFNQDIALINNSWSHFLIDRATIKKVGWFDERFEALGNEDEDYECRLAFANISLKSFTNKHVYNVVDVPKNYAYAANMALVNLKYAKVNQDFFNLKWELSATPKEGFKFVSLLKAYVKLKPGMETPVFYPI